MLRKIIIYILFILACLTVAHTFVTADTYVQLASAVVSYPLLAYIALKLFPRKAAVVEVPSKKKKTTGKKVSATTLATKSKDSSEVEAIENNDKREFLRLIGVAGITYFLYSVFNKKGEAAFFGRGLGQSSVKLEDSSGNVINPAQEQPTDGYQISDLDEFAPDYIYYGCTKLDGNWYIMRQDPYNGSFRYVQGKGNYPNVWNNRQALTYDYYYNVFTQ